MIGPGKAQKNQSRKQRLSAALRENLKRRKAQARGRAGGGAGGSADEESRMPDAPDDASPPDFRRNPGPKSD